MHPDPLVDLTQIDLTRIVADKEAIRKANPQRFDMEHLDAVVLYDPTRQLVVGYKDVRHEEFWVRGHMPGYPLLPGVLMCEAAAQLGGYYVHASGAMGPGFIGFGGMENVRFRSPVYPGSRLVLIAKATKVHRRQCQFHAQGFVDNVLVFHGDISAVPLKHKGES